MNVKTWLNEVVFSNKSKKDQLISLHKKANVNIDIEGILNKHDQWFQIDENTKKLQINEILNLNSKKIISELAKDYPYTPCKR